MFVYAWLVVNGFIQTEKFKELFAWLVRAAGKQGCKLEIRANTELLPQYAMCTCMQQGNGRMPQFAIFWDKDIRLARLLEKAGIPLFNCAESIEICDDKSRTFLELMGSGIRMPKTIIGPKTFCMEGYPNLDFLQGIEQQIGYPMVIKECYGSFGQQVYLVHNFLEAEACLAQVKNRPCLFQEFVAASSGRDVRIQMVGQHAVAAMQRSNQHDFRANITNGGSMEPYTPTTEQIQMAQTVMQVLKLDFAGIDLLFGESGEPMLCEVNSNAHFVNICKCTGVNVADYIIRYCLGHCKSVS